MSDQKLTNSIPQRTLNYLDHLDLMSEAIYNWSLPPEQIEVTVPTPEQEPGTGRRLCLSLKNLLEASSIPRIQIYRRHLFGNIFAVLSEDYPVTSQYLTYPNFRYLIKEFIGSKQITSANIFNASLKFKNYISQRRDIHGDEIVEDLARLDYFWSYAPAHVGRSLSLPRGVLELWDNLRRGEEVSSLDTMRIIREDLLSVTIQTDHNGWALLPTDS